MRLYAPNLQKLWKPTKDKLVIVGFPANNFRRTGTRRQQQEIKRILPKENYGVTFP